MSNRMLRYATNDGKVTVCRAKDPSKCRFHTEHYESAQEAMEHLEIENAKGAIINKLSRKTNDGKPGEVRIENGTFIFNEDAMLSTSFMNRSEISSIISKFKETSENSTREKELIQSIGSTEKALKNQIKEDLKNNIKSRNSYRKVINADLDRVDDLVNSEGEEISKFRAGDHDDLQRLVGRTVDIHDDFPDDDVRYAIRHEVEEDYNYYDYPSAMKIKSIESDGSGMTLVNREGYTITIKLPAGSINADSINDARENDVNRARKYVDEMREDLNYHGQDMIMISTISVNYDVLSNTMGLDYDDKVVNSLTFSESIDYDSRTVSRMKSKISSLEYDLLKLHEEHILTGEQASREIVSSMMIPVNKTNGRKIIRTLPTNVRKEFGDFRVVGESNRSNHFLIEENKVNEYTGAVSKINRVIDKNGKTMRSALRFDDGETFHYFLKWKN